MEIMENVELVENELVVENEETTAEELDLIDLEGQEVGPVAGIVISSVLALSAGFAACKAKDKLTPVVSRKWSTFKDKGGRIIDIIKEKDTVVEPEEETQDIVEDEPIEEPKPKNKKKSKKK